MIFSVYAVFLYSSYCLSVASILYIVLSGGLPPNEGLLQLRIGETSVKMKYGKL